MSVYKYPLIAREGWPIIAVLGLAALAVHLYAGPGWSIILWLLALASLIYFRDPPRSIPPRPLGIISPVDGTVTGVEQTDDPYVDRKALRISIRTGIFSAKSIHSPTEGKIQNQWFVAAKRDPEGRQRYAMWLQTDEHDDVVIEMCPPAIIPPVCHVQAGERIGQGARCGFIYLGGEIVLFLPENSRIEVEAGQQVTAGSDIVATLVHP